MDEYLQSVVAAGGLISQQEAENQKQIAKAGAGDSSDPLGIGQLLSGKQSPVAIPSGPNPIDIMTSGVSSGLPPLPSASGDAAGKFSCGASPESVGGLTLDTCVANLSPAEASRLSMLAQQWQQLGADLTSSITVFHNIVQSKMATGGWTGSSGKAVGDAAHKLVRTSTEISAQASANAAAIVGWAGALGDTKSYMESLSSSRTAAMATAPPESRATLQNEIDTMARFKMLGTYNPGVTAISSGLSNLSDPAAGSTGVPLVIGGFGGSGGGGGAGSGASTASSGAGSGGGGSSSGGGGGGGGGPTGARTGSDAAGQLTRQATGDPAGTAAKNAASQGAQNPAAAAQQAVSKAGESAKGLGGSRSGAGSMTRPSGLGAMSEAEKSAASKAAAAMKGAGGGGGGAGGGAGKLGGVGGLGGAAAAESALSRNSSALSAAEKAMAGQQGATAARPAGPAAGGPMGARGAGAKGEEGKEHRAAKYLKHTENGEEIAGDLPDTAPPVLGGLNLDTTDDTDASSKAGDRT
ncbi:hypothetical protein [Williamsia deligens]|uniref:PPE family protein n=1 Tax=Williamsia deligens TaxID=321325 RepID=A0ABW3G8R0_9NOCA|nr:hypothetical protein [Williamsia deligens]